MQMGSYDKPISSSGQLDASSISGLQQKHQQDLSNLNIMHLEELNRYIQFVIWRLALGLASSIGLARLSGRANDAIQELDFPSTEQSGLMANILNQIKLFDLTGIICGQLGIPFWKFFLTTVIEKAIIKIHIQMIFISICNNYFLDWMENKLIWALSFVPSLEAVLPDIITKVHGIRDKFLGTTPMPSGTKYKKWEVSLGTIWNTVVLLILVNFSATIAAETAKSYLKKEQEKELDALNKRNCSQ